MKWIPVSERPVFDKQPIRQFIRIEGERYHSDVYWARVWCGEAFIRPDGADDGFEGYRLSDMKRLCQDGDMDLISAKVTHWMPASFPALDVSPQSSA
jgi:hypothetical protein